jgi:hypothetical protein
MPGAGGNFIMRILLANPNIGKDITYKQLEYNDCPKDDFCLSNWGEWEHQLTKEVEDRLFHDHEFKYCWLRLIATSDIEFEWSGVQALWKNNNPSHEYWASKIELPAKHMIPIKDLWSWESLCTHIPILIKDFTDSECNTLLDKQKELWRQWKQTWCPEQMYEQYQQQFKSIVADQMRKTN